MLALLFIIALWLDPLQPARSEVAGSIVLLSYFAWSAVLVVIAWRSWWYDCRMAAVVHVIDMTAYIAAVYFTEGSNSEFVSPFMTFAAFMLIAAMVRWGWTGVAVTAIALVVTNAMLAAAFVAFGLKLNIYRFGRRQTYMIALSLMMIWLSGDRRGSRTVHLRDTPGAPGERREALLAGALAQARGLMRARGAAIAVTHDEEPWIDLLVDRDGRIDQARRGPGPLTDAISMGGRPMLFDMVRQRRIEAIDEYRIAARSGPVSVPLAVECGMDNGIVAPFSSASSQGHLLLWGIGDMCVDDLPWVTALSREIGLALDREEMAMLAKSSAVSDIRKALARDLHDSVAQFLAGTLFRLEALRRWIREGNDPEGEIGTMKDALRREQGQLRVMIDRLRRGEEGDRPTDMVEEMESLLDEMGHHWHISASLFAETRPLPIPIHLAHELRQLVREAVANAARHGRCDEVEIALNGDEALIRLSIRDDGIGFSRNGTAPRPRSISERVEALGGRLAITESRPDTLRPGARLDIELPARTTA